MRWHLLPVVDPRANDKFIEFQFSPLNLLTSLGSVLILAFSFQAASSDWMLTPLGHSNFSSETECTMQLCMYMSADYGLSPDSCVE